MKREEGFTLIELVIVVSCFAITMPICFLMLRTMQVGQMRALGRVENAQVARALSEDLRRDLRAMKFKDDTSLELTGDGKCKSVEYRLESTGVLSRIGDPGCGPMRPVARNVESITRKDWGVQVWFSKRVGTKEPARYRLDIGLVGK